MIERELSSECTKTSSSHSSQGLYRDNDEENDFFESHHGEETSETLGSETTTVDIEMELEKILKSNEEQMGNGEDVTKCYSYYKTFSLRPSD